MARQRMVYIDQLCLMDAMSGEEIMHIDVTDRFREYFGNPYAVVYRGDLRGAFVEACRADPRAELRTARVQLQSRELGNHVYHPAGVHALLRNQMMRSFDTERCWASLDWLYGKGGGLTEASV
jgi:hypothetical protein